MQQHHVIIVPGLNNGVKLRPVFTATKKWQKYGLNVHVHLAPWDKNPLSPKLERLLLTIDELVKEGHQVSLIGVSAGGSLAMNAFFQRKDTIHKLVNISGRLREGEKVFPPLSFGKRTYPSYQESVLLCEDQLPSLLPSDKKKIMTIRGFFDELVPVSTIPVEGAKNMQVPMMLHFTVMAYALTIDKMKIIDFLKNQSKSGGRINDPSS